MRPHKLAVAVALLLTGVGCANGMTPRETGTLPVVRVTEQQNGATVTLSRGQRLHVVLHSTYWQFQNVSNPGALRLRGTPEVLPKLPCVAGGGCGTVTASYVAWAVGSAVVTAERNGCGEAVGCTAATGRFILHVVVRTRSVR